VIAMRCRSCRQIS